MSGSFLRISVSRPRADVRCFDLCRPYRPESAIDEYRESRSGLGTRLAAGHDRIARSVA